MLFIINKSNSIACSDKTTAYRGCMNHSTRTSLNHNAPCVSLDECNFGLQQSSSKVTLAAKATRKVNLVVGVCGWCALVRIA
jgi:hypothetical protein